MRPRFLNGCAKSVVLAKAFEDAGWDAWTCDIQPSEGWDKHIQDDVLKHLNDGWDLGIFHPDCTYLTVTGNRWMKPEYSKRFPDRKIQRESAIKFFLSLTKAPIDKIAIENPVCIMSSIYRKPDCIIQPWQFGDKAVKKTCLWLKGLPPLLPTYIVEPEYKIFNSTTHKSGKSKYPILWAGTRDKEARSRNFPGISQAMANQWGKYVLSVLK